MVKTTSKPASVVVIGNPNCGKTTLFNGLTGQTARIGNWSGVTVDERRGRLLGNEDIEVVDLPGIYSLSAVSEDEHIARNYVLARNFDLIINVIDASNLRRNLFLTLTLLELGKPMLLVFSMIDLAVKQGIKVNPVAFTQALGIPAIGINVLLGVDLRNTRREIRMVLDQPAKPSRVVSYPQVVEEYLSEFASRLEGASRSSALLLLEEDEETLGNTVAQGRMTHEEIQAAQESIQADCGETPDIVIADAKFTFINEMLAAGSTVSAEGTTRSEKIDKIVLNPWLGIPIFLGVIYLLFWTVMHFGGAFISFFDILARAFFVEGLGVLLEGMGAPQWVVVLLADGVGVGIQTVATFIPIIFTTFFFLSLLEESGYMARASYVMNRFMGMLGLPGKAFVPMLVGFGCTVPAVMATRTLENKKDRYLTVFLAPFMSCGARLPVYALFGAAFFGRRAGLMVVSLYLVGLLMAIVTAFLLKSSLFKGQVSHYVMELPPYHAPQLGKITKRTWFRLKDFIFRAGQVIVIAVLILSFFNSLGVDGSFGNEGKETSVLASISRAVTPVFTPMGIEKDNWPATVGLITGLFAKEAIVGTMNSLYGQMAAESGETAGDEDFKLTKAIKAAFISIPASFSGILGNLADPFDADMVGSEADTVGEKIGADSGTFAALRSSFANDWRRAYAYLLFVLIYAPCVAAIGAIIREIGPQFGVLSITYLMILAWSVATVFYQVSGGHSLFWIVFAVVLVALFLPIFNIVSGRHKLWGNTEG